MCHIATPQAGHSRTIIRRPVELTVPRIDDLLETALYVDDLDRSVAFYERIFGFTVIDSDPGRLVAMRIADRRVLLVCKKGASRSLSHTAHDGDGHTHLAMAVPRAAIPDWNEWLAQHDIEVIETRDWPRGGRSLYFRDPDGHLLEVASPGVWSIY